MLRVEGPAAIEIQHQSGVILERINRFFGWQAVGRIALRQAPLSRRKPRRRRMTILDRFRLDDRVAIVTDASSVLGAALAKGLAEAGADVVLAAPRTDGLQEAADIVRRSGRRVLTVPTDITDPSRCTALVEATLDKFTRVDILVNNAELVSVGPAIGESVHDFRSVIDVNLHGSSWAAQACGRVMQPGSSIVNISSILGITNTGLPRAAYSASKASSTPGSPATSPNNGVAQKAFASM